MRSPGPRSRWATAAFAITLIGTFGTFGFVLAACGDDDYETDQQEVDDGQGRYEYDQTWHVIKVQSSEGATYECVVSDFKEGVWCK